ncbi:MAG TPA: 50S ribosomal protein L29 [Candidatus Acidoferrales bacterium]|nr:50S ribosomal protein L29 [Candidatus Acidoferrales bacterium]
MAKRGEKLRELDTPELEVQQQELSEQIFRLRFQLTTGQAEALNRLRTARKQLARVKTMLRERELGQANGKR